MPPQNESVTVSSSQARDPGSGFILCLRSCVFPLLASPESAPLPSHGLKGLKAVLPSSNLHGAAGAYDASEIERGAVIFVMRGRVTLDAKAGRAAEVWAAAVIILDVSGDPIGPDLDEIASIVVGCVARGDVETVVELIRSSIEVGNSNSVDIMPSANGAGLVLSDQLDGLTNAVSKMGITYLSQTDCAGHTPLFYAVTRNSPANGSMAMLRFILASMEGSAINTVDFVKGQTPLHIASKVGCSQAVELLCAHGAQMLPRLSDGCYPVHLATNAATLRALQKAGASFNCAATDGTTPLAMAARRGDIACVRLLVQSGCDGSAAAVQAVAKGAARAYLDDVIGYELEAFVGGREETFRREIERAARERLVEDLGDYVDRHDVHIEVNTNEDSGSLFATRYKLLRKSFCSGAEELPPLLFLWHGCASAILPEIMRSGFKTSFSNLTFNVYGAGIYFATDAKLSAFFVTRNVRESTLLPCDAEGRYSLIFSAVALGRTGVREALVGGNEAAKTRMKADLKHPANRNPPLGCDSATGTHLKEVIVYENALAFPMARVSFRLVGGTLIPDPYDADLSSGRLYLRPLTAVPRGLGNICTLSGRAVALDGAEPSIDRNASLVMNWSSSGSEDPLSNEELLERAANLESRISVLERENAALRATIAASLSLRRS